MCGGKDCGCGCGDDNAGTLSRRELLKYAASAMGAGAAGFWTPSTAHAAQADLLGSVYQGMGDCFEHRIVGICICGFPPHPCGFKVKHYLPVAIMECVNTGDDSVVIGSSQAGLFNGGRRLSSAGPDRGTGFQANVWTISDSVRAAMSFGWSLCGWCHSRNARESGGGGTGAGSIANDAGDVAGCGLSASSIISGISSLGGGILPLAYSSALDQKHWSTGCRDLFEATARAPLVPAMCSVNMPDYLADQLYNNIPSLGGLTPSNLSRNDVCIGETGPLYPRQTRAEGNTDPVGAMVTAWRAVHLAHYDLGTFGYKVSPDDNKFQTLYPKVGTKCFRYTDSLEHIQSMVDVSEDGRYAFILWVPVTCCINFGQYGCTAATG